MQCLVTAAGERAAPAALCLPPRLRAPQAPSNRPTQHACPPPGFPPHTLLLARHPYPKSYCYQGSGAIVHTAPHPLGPWTPLGDIACVPAAAGAAIADAAAPPSAATRTAAFLAAIGAPAAGPGLAAEPTPGQGCQYVDPKTTSALRSQQSDIFEVSLADGSTGWIWAGDRWQQSWDGTKAHDVSAEFVCVRARAHALQCPSHSPHAPR